MAGPRRRGVLQAAACLEKGCRWRGAWFIPRSLRLLSRRQPGVRWWVIVAGEEAGMTFQGEDYLPQAADSFQKATGGSGLVIMGKGDVAQAAQIAALLAIAQRLDAMLNRP